MNLFNKSARTLAIVCLSTQTLLGSLISSTPSMREYAGDSGKLTVYTDVPGHEKSVIKGYASRARSDVYQIRVRSAATGNQWVQCFANMTYNRGREMPVMDGFKTATATHAYQKHTAGWTHTYANIEMSDNTPVEVEISRIGGMTLDGSATIVKSAVHPAHKIIPGSKKDENGRVYFKINKPCQIVIDINGQMDDHNAAFPPDKPGGCMPDGSPVHSVALYANPIIAKPVAGPENRIVTVNPDDSRPTVHLTPPEPSTYDTLAFAPGVHHIGPGFKVYPGKNYYIPGDAILYGNLSNRGVDKGSYRCNGDRINIHGYGTICGIQIPHYQNNKDNPEYPEWNGLKSEKSGDVGIVIQNAWDVKITGVTITDPANFNTKIDGQHKRVNDQGLLSWVKFHSWRVNGDGCGGYIKIEDSFFRTSDDSTYVRDWRRRCTFWKDTNANIFRSVGHIAGGVEDCDILYARWRDPRGVGSIFEFASLKGVKPKTTRLAVVFRNNRFHDRLANPRHLIALKAPETFSGLRFENMTFPAPLNQARSVIEGSKEAPYAGQSIFKNIMFQNGSENSNAVKLSGLNFKDYFETNEFVDQKVFN